MDTLIQATVMGLVQGLTEFLPISSSGHLVILPALLGWHDPFINSLAFSVMLHLGTLAALLVYFREDWYILIPAGLAALRDRSFRGDPDRRLAWLLVATTVPAVLLGPLLNDTLEAAVRRPELVAITLVIGGAILWTADRIGRKTERMGRITFPIALGIGAAQAVALIPGISRSGMSIAGGLVAGLTREEAARFGFLMATPIIAMAGAFESFKLVRGEAGAAIQAGPLAIGVLASIVAGLAAIHLMLRYLRNHSYDLFVAYRIVLAAVVLVWFLAP